MLTLLNVANVFPYKGHACLIQALDLIKDRMPTPWRLWIAGAGAPLPSNGLPIEWLGERQDVPSLMGQADIFILPSHAEGLSNALLEAMAAGLPVIATAVGGNIEVVGGAGMLVPPHDPKALSDAILILAWNEDTRDHLGAMARRRVRELFPLEGCVDKYIQLYKECS